MGELTRKTTSGRKPKSRGSRAELEVVNILRSHGYPAHRNFASGGYGGSDVIGLPGFAVEVKMIEKLNVWAALAQCATAASPTETPLLAFRRNRSQWYAAMPLADLLGLIKESQL